MWVRGRVACGLKMFSKILFIYPKFASFVFRVTIYLLCGIVKFLYVGSDSVRLFYLSYLSHRKSQCYTFIEAILKQRKYRFNKCSHSICDRSSITTLMHFLVYLEKSIVNNDINWKLCRWMFALLVLDRLYFNFKHKYFFLKFNTVLHVV